MSSLPQSLVAYQNPTSATPSSHSKGSFGAVFIVLAVIIVVTTIACIIGRLCARRLCNPKTPLGCDQINNDVEQAFGASTPMAKPAAYAGQKGEAEAEADDGMLRGDAMKKHQGIRTAEINVKFHRAKVGAKPRK